MTGASTGIGYHLARVFAGNGFDLLMTADENRITEAAGEIEALGAKAYSVKADLAKDEEVERLWNEVLATARPVDAIALNAGVGTAGDFARETGLETELRMIDLNVKSTVHLAKLAVQQMVGPGALYARFRQSQPIREKSKTRDGREEIKKSASRAMRILISGTPEGQSLAGVSTG